MDVLVINRISDFDVGLNSSLSSRTLHHGYSFLKWGALLVISFFASFTRIKTLVLRLRHVDLSLPSPTLVYDYDSDSDSSCSPDDSSDDEGDYDDDKGDDSVNGDSRVKRFSYYEDDDEEGISGNVPWMRRCSGSFGDLLGSSGVVKLWENLDLKGSHDAVASFFNKCGASSSSLPPAVFMAAEKKGPDAVEVSAWDARYGFRMPALVAEWRQPGRLLGKIVKVNVDKIYVGEEVNGEMTVGDKRMVNGAMMGLTESDVVTVVRRRRLR